jgi:anaerobic magnesium-protoporphyrin IX monomethyl ester cyclase
VNAILIMPSFRGNKFGKDWQKNPTVSPPLGLLYVGGALKRSGFNVRVLDLNVERIERDEFCRLVGKADLLGLSVLTTARDIARDLIADIKGINPSAKVICGGPHINSTLKPFPGADVTFMGEGEETAGEVCRYLVRGDLNRLKKFQGLYYFEGGEWIKTGSTVVIKDLNRSPTPARQLIDPSRYGELLGIRLSKRVTAIATSRGCPFKCNFCVRRGVFRYRHRDPVNVVDEIEQIIDQGYDLLIFNEDNFTVVPERSIEIMREIKHRGLRIRIIMQLRADSVSEELMVAFKEAGVWSLIFGIESGTQEILDYYDKGTTVAQGRQAVQLADRLGIFTYGFFIIGAPPERERHFFENLEFMTSIPLDFAGVNILDYQFGSKIWSQKVREGLINPEQTIVPTGPKFGALPYRELVRYLRWSYRKFYLRPGHYWRLLKKCWRVRDFSLFLFILRFSMKLLKRFRPFALAEELPGSILGEV